MINSTPRSDRITRPDLVASTSTRPHVIPPGVDRFSAENSTALRAALAAQPEIRPEVVARGLVLAADPAYPSPAVLRQVGEAILRAPDFSEDAS
jgi:hypothetical protein